jgi:hypothetical protein
MPSEEKKPKEHQTREFRGQGPGDFGAQILPPVIGRRLILIHANSNP